MGRRVVRPGDERVPTTVVTGAAGYLGRALVSALSASGHRIVAVDRSFPAEARRTPPQSVTIVGDACELPDLLRARRGRRVDHVVHAAAVTAAPGAGALATVDYLRDHLAGSLAALRTAAEHDASAVLIGSAAVFDRRQRSDLDETVAPLGMGPYATVKRAAELAWAEAAAAGLPAMTVRLGNLFGGDEGPSATRPRVSLFRDYLDSARDHGVIEVREPGAVRDWTYLPDVATRLVDVLAERQPASTTVHLVAPDAHSDLELASAVAESVPSTEIRVEPTGAPLPRGVLRSRYVNDPWAWTPLERAVALTVAHGARVGASS